MHLFTYPLVLCDLYTCLQYVFSICADNGGICWYINCALPPFMRSCWLRPLFWQPGLATARGPAASHRNRRACNENKSRHYATTGTTSSSVPISSGQERDVIHGSPMCREDIMTHAKSVCYVRSAPLHPPRRLPHRWPLLPPVSLCQPDPSVAAATTRLQPRDAQRRSRCSREPFSMRVCSYSTSLSIQHLPRLVLAAPLHRCHPQLL